MQIYHAVPGEPVPLGRRWEHHARRIVFDISGWVETFGAGTVTLLHQRQGDEAPYPVPVTRTDADGVTVNDQTGTLVSWDVTNTDTYYQCRYGKAELRYYLGTGSAPVFLVKSDIYKTVVENTLGAALAEAPVEAVNWLDTLLDASRRLDSLDLDGLSTQISDARTAVGDAQTAAQNAASASADAQAAALAAQDVPASVLPFTGAAVTLSNDAPPVTVIDANCNAKTGAVIGVQAQIPVSVTSVAEGSAQGGWTALSQARITMRLLYDNAGAIISHSQTLDSGRHVLRYQHFFNVASSGNHNVKLGMMITGGTATVAAGAATMLLSGVKAATA